MNRAIPAVAILLVAALSPAALPQDPSKKGPPAFVPQESSAAAAQLRTAAAAARAGKAEEAAEAYQAVVDGPLAARLAAHDRDRDTLEQAAERAQREMASAPALREAIRRRCGEIAAKALAAALSRDDPRGLRDAFARFPLTDAGAAAGLMLARAAWRAGDAGECLGILDRLLFLHPDGPPPGIRAADLLGLRAAAAAATGDADLLEETARAAAALPADPALGARIAAARAALAPPGPPGPRGPLLLQWSWMPEEEDLPGPDDGTRRPLVPDGFPAPPDHLLAAAGGRAYWTDRYRVTALDLATGAVVARSHPVSGGFLPAGPGEEHEGETFAPAADERGVVAALDLPNGGGRGGRAGTLNLFDRGLLLLASRGGVADLEHPEFTGRYVFHGRPLLLGDRVYCAATEASGEEGQGPGDVRTHVLAFRREGLEPLWDTFVAYGIGLRRSAVAPAGSVVERHGRLYLATNTGLEACLDARTGSVLWAHRYRTPEAAPTPRLSANPDQTLAPPVWYESPPAFSGDLVAFAARDSYAVDFVHQRPVRGEGPKFWDAGYLRADGFERPRLDTEAMTTGWTIPGPAGTFFLAGRTATATGAAALVLRDLSPAAEDPIPWRADLEEDTVVGLPVRAADAIYTATDKALYRVPFPSPGAAERVAVFPPSTEASPRPSPGNLLVLPDRVLSVNDDGVMCFGPPPPRTPR